MTTNSVVEQVEACANAIETRFKKSGDWIRHTSDTNIKLRDSEFSGDKYRRAHISIIDSRELNKLYFLHVTIFPHINNPAPIYGFDIIAGPTRVSGAFHDFSKSGKFDDNMSWFANRTKDIVWNKKRELPEWAKSIFSDSIVAIGAVGSEELAEFISLGLETLDYYLDNIDKTNNQDIDTTENQNFYCQQQRLNPHTPRVLVNLGFTEHRATQFVENTLFPLYDKNTINFME